MPVQNRRLAKRLSLDFKCGPRCVLSRKGASVTVGPTVYVLATTLTHKRDLSVQAMKIRIWGSQAADHPDNTVSKVGQRLNEKLTELGSNARVLIADGRVRLRA